MADNRKERFTLQGCLQEGGKEYSNHFDIKPLPPSLPRVVTVEFTEGSFACCHSTLSPLNKMVFKVNLKAEIMRAQDMLKMTMILSESFFLKALPLGTES